MRAAWLIPIIVVIFSVVLISPRTGKADPADSKSVSDGESYNYHGTFNYYYPSPSPTPSPFRQAIPSREVSTSSGLSWSAAEEISAAEAIFTAASVLLTFGLLVFAYAQWRTAQMEIRAYLSVMSIEIIVPSIDDPAYVPEPHLVGDQIVVNVNNSGKTPAYHVGVTVVGLPRPASTLLPDDFRYPEAGSTSPHFLMGTTVVGPGSTHRFVVAPGPAMAHDMPAVRARQLWLYVYGHINYNDVFYRARFFKSPRRRSDFCWVYVQGSTPEQYIFQTYKEHNEAT
jgi:hypothetical protein